MFVFLSLFCAAVFYGEENSHLCRRGRALSLLTWNKKITLARFSNFPNKRMQTSYHPSGTPHRGRLCGVEGGGLHSAMGDMP